MYLDNLNEETKKYFNILSNDFPNWLIDYINTKEMQRIDKISLSCGMDYTKVFDIKYWYSNLDHSVGVALIIWHFTHDKKQTLAGLFHDIATPAFKHCIDFLNGDYEKQESIEERTVEIIKNSKEISQLLKRDNIKLEEVIDYKIYPIADNETPKLSADRLEYNFSSGLTLFKVWSLEDIKDCYDNLIVLKNEDDIYEIGFKDIKKAEKYIHTVSKLWPVWRSNKDKISMQFIADMMKSMNNLGFLSINDLYNLSEEEIINKILNCDNKYLVNKFKQFQENKIVYDSDILIENKYCVNIFPKRRYIIPLVKTDNGLKKINLISSKAKNDIDNYLNNEESNYCYFDFDFKIKDNL